MIINLKAKNVFVFQDIEIDFTIDSKKSGKYIKDNDFKEFKKIKIQKKIGIIGSNASGKSSFLEILKLFNTFYNIDNFYRTIHQNTLFDFSNKFLLKKVNEKNQFHKKISLYEKSEGLEMDNDKLFLQIKEVYESFFVNNCFDSNKNTIEFEIKFIYKDEIILGNYFINKNGNIKYFFKKNNEKIFNNEINFFELNTLSNIKLTYENWELNLLVIPFEPKYDFGIIAPWNYPISTNNRSFLSNIFDYTRNNGKTNHFLKWVKIADSSIKNLISDSKNKIFLFQKENESINAHNLSLGTKKWIILYYFLFIAIKKNDEITNIVVYDEIENSFHNKLISAFINIFDEKIKNSQLVFTSHSPEIFGKTFKHDGIYLSKQSKNKCSINRLDKFKLRKDIVFRKFYLEEEIGYHPDDQTILDFYDED